MWEKRAAGALVVLVAVQLSVPGSYLPPGIQKAAATAATPDDHFTAGPHCSVIDRAAGALVVLVAIQLSVLGLYFPPVFKSTAYRQSAPDDHFAAGPDRRVTASGSGRVGGAGGCPTIRAGIVSPAGVQRACQLIRPTRSFHCQSRLPCDLRAAGALVVLVAVQLFVPGLYLPPVFNSRTHCQIHPRRSFHCQSRLPCARSCIGRVGGAGGCPTIGARIVSPARIQIAAASHLRPRRSFHCRSTLRCDLSGRGRVSRAGGYPTIGAGIVSPAGVRVAHVSKSAPNNHFAAGPHSRVKVSSVRHVGGAGRCPRIRNAWSWCPGSRWCRSRRRRPGLRAISPAGVRTPGINSPQTIISLPVQTAVWLFSGSRRVGDAGGCPTIGAGIVSPAGVEGRRCHNRFRPRRSFRCQSRLPCDRLGQRARWWCWWLSNYPCWDCISRRCSKALMPSSPPQTIISLPVQTAVCRLGQRARWWCWWLSNCRCWDCICPPVFKQPLSCQLRPRRSFHCRSTLPCDSLGQRARWWCWWLSNCRCWDCISRRCSNQVPLPRPPQTIISLPVHTAVCTFGQRARWWCWWLSNCSCWDCISRRCSNRMIRISSTPDDHFTASPHRRVSIGPRARWSVLVAVQLSVLGLYLPPVFK